MASALEGHSGCVADRKDMFDIKICLRGIIVGSMSMDISQKPDTLISDIRYELAEMFGVAPYFIYITFQSITIKDKCKIKTYLEDIKVLYLSHAMTLEVDGGEEHKIAAILQQKSAQISTNKKSKNIVIRGMNPFRDTEITVDNQEFKRYMKQMDKFAKK